MHGTSRGLWALLVVLAPTGVPLCVAVMVWPLYYFVWLTASQAQFNMHGPFMAWPHVVSYCSCISGACALQTSSLSSAQDYARVVQPAVLQAQ